MSSCDGSGYMIGCPGCPECREEMEVIRDLQRQAAGALQGLALKYPRPQGDVDPWAEPNLEESAS